MQDTGYSLLILQLLRYTVQGILSGTVLRYEIHLYLSYRALRTYKRENKYQKLNFNGRTYEIEDFINEKNQTKSSRTDLNRVRCYVIRTLYYKKTTFRNRLVKNKFSLKTHAFLVCNLFLHQCRFTYFHLDGFVGKEPQSKTAKLHREL